MPKYVSHNSVKEKTSTFQLHNARWRSLFS